MSRFSVGEKVVLIRADKAPQFQNEIVDIVSIPSEFGTDDCTIRTPDGNKWTCWFSSLRKLPPDAEDPAFSRLKRVLEQDQPKQQKVKA